MIKSVLVWAVVGFTCVVGVAQDVNFSQFYNNPMYLNAAFTGNINCKYRVGVNYKSQFRTVAEPYVTINAFGDFKVKENTESGDVMGAGFIVYNDKAGLGRLSTTKAMASFGYHKNLSKGKTSQYLSAGITAGIVQKSLDGQSFTWNAQWTSNGFDKSLDPGEPGIDNGQFTPIAYPEISLGVVYSISTADNIGLQAGINIGNVLGAKESFLDDEGNQLGRKPTVFLSGFTVINKEITLEPAVMYTTVTKANELLVGSNLNYQVDKSDFFMIAGLWVRNLRDVSPTIGFEKQGVKVQLSYDFNITQDLSTAAQGRRGVELGITYSPACMAVKNGKPVPFLRNNK